MTCEREACEREDGIHMPYIAQSRWWCVTGLKLLFRQNFTTKLEVGVKKARLVTRRPLTMLV